MHHKMIDSVVSDPWRLIVIGAGWHSREVASYLQELSGTASEIELAGFIDQGKPPGPWEGAQVIGGFDALGELLRSNASFSYRYITATGNNAVRRSFVETLEKLPSGNIHPWTLCHPSAYVGQQNRIGLGCCLAPKSIVTTRSSLGRHCILNVGASISHDCEIGDFVNLNPGVTICGNVRIAEGAYIGAGATIIDKVSIGAWTIVGAGAVVNRDLPGRVTAVGVPARIIKTR